MAYVLKVDGSRSPLPDTKLETLKEAVGGYIELVFTADRKQYIVLDEEGKLKGKPLNVAATILYDPLRKTGDFIVGDVVIAGLNEID